MNNYIVTSIENGSMIGGNKAKDDVRWFLTHNANFKSMDVKVPSNKIGKFTYAHVGLKRQITSSKANSLMLQYPVASEYLEDQIIKIAHETSIKVYFLIHDISGLQYPDVVPNGFLARELHRFSTTDGLIVHNESMKKWLSQHGVQVPMVKLKIFDYKSNGPMQKKIPYSGSVCFAGGLGRANFLQKLSMHHEVHIMGPNKLHHYPNCVTYDGQFVPDQLSPHLLQNFGLVWSGNSVEKCSGHLGEYLKYNDPHKASLYLSNGIPVIIWDQAALAPFIVNHGVGIAIGSLNELDDVLDNVSDNQYKEMKQKAKDLGNQLRRGKFIIDAANKMLS